MQLKNEDSPKFLTVTQTARRLNISPSAIYMFSAGTAELPRYRFGKSIRFLISDIEEFENNSRQISARGNNEFRK
jgi:predicted DNA-binding transcriptional regulator AlpA